MLSHWPIRNKVYVGIGLLLVIVGTLSASGFLGVYSYRSLVKSLSGRANELPLTTALAEQVSDLRALAGAIHGQHKAAADSSDSASRDHDAKHDRFQQSFRAVRQTLDEYHHQLEANDDRESKINDSRQEWATIEKIEATMTRIASRTRGSDWVAAPDRVEKVRADLRRLQQLTSELPSHLHERLHTFALDVRTQYRTLIILTWISTALAGVLLALFLRLFYKWVFLPLRALVRGSRRVAAGEFSHRIHLDTEDEMSELAEAMNDMTARFQAIRDDLDRQVQERTKQVVRSEQLASVGFLAAGVAHEINNPLASIALCAESLESRILEILGPDGKSDTGGPYQVVHTYLRMIQDEAFRCKGITERLLDFSRIGDVKRQNADLRELVQGVIDMVGHLGRYQDKHVEFAEGEPLIAPINSQELKQVVLNLITNGLDSLAPGGMVRIEMASRDGFAEIVFTDDGCGMTDEVRQHLFEPFFTRRRTGQGIGLGLSITYRIVADHDGQIDVHSDGPGHGSRFTVRLPLADQHKENKHRYQAA